MSDIQSISQNNYILQAPPPSSTMSTTALEYDSSGFISGYAGSAFKAGDTLPEYVTDASNYVTATSGNIDDTISAVTTNSGAWGGSALPISAGPGVKLEMNNGTLVASLDETVLWEGSLTGTAGSLTANLSEPYNNFEYVKLTMGSQYGSTYTYDSSASNFQVFSPYVGGGSISLYALMFGTNSEKTQITVPSGHCVFCIISGNGVSDYANRSNINVDEITLRKVVGVNRK